MASGGRLGGGDRRAPQSAPAREARGRDGGRYAGSASEFGAIVESAARQVRREAPSIADAPAAECWAAVIVGTWRELPAILPGLELVETFGGAFIAELERAGDESALATLRALAAVAPEPESGWSGEAAQRLAERGVAEPGWAPALGAARPSEAPPMHEEIFDDGVTLVQFEQ